MTAFEGAVCGGDQVVESGLRNIEAGFVVKATIVKGPVFGFQSIEEEKFFFHLVDGLENQLVTGRQVFDFVCQSYVNGPELLVKGIGEE